MIYLVSNQRFLFPEDANITPLSVEESLEMLSSWEILQTDTETKGKDPHLGELLCVQFGNKKAGNQIVIDPTTIDIRLYKNILETKNLIFQNGKFDLQWFYNYDIKPRKIYDIMIVEQFLHLGFPVGLALTPEEYKERKCNYPYHINIDKKGKITYKLSYALDAISKKRINVDIDKTVRGQIIWRGLDYDVINYAANDVVYLEDIMNSQIEDIRKIPNAMIGARLECSFVPVVAYLEWCGIKLDVVKWQHKMAKDKEHLKESIEALNQFVINTPSLKEKFTFVDAQGDLFTGFDLTPKVNINWSSSDQVVKVAKILGFDTKVTDKDTDEDKESAMKKHLVSQVGINDEFLRLYFGQGEEDDEDYFPGYSGSAKVVSSFGQGHIDAINPKTGRIHTVYKSIGTISGRMSSGSKKANEDLAKYKKIPVERCKYPNMQQLPKNAETRGSFIAEKGNLFCSCDYAAMEARIGADVYNEHKLLDEFLYGSGDTHAAYAKAVFADELKDVDTKDVKKKRPDLRNKVKSIEFAVQFGSDGSAVAPQLKISVPEAQKLVQNLLNGMTGLKSFKQKSSKFVLNNGYVEILPQTGHRGYWYDWEYWKKVQESYDSNFWEEYKMYHKGTGDSVAIAVKQHFKAKSKWCERMSLNLPTQGGGAVVLKGAMIRLFNWVIDNGYFGKILFCNFTHDECNTEFPEELKDTYPKLVAQFMEEEAAKYYHKLPIPAISEVGDHWIH
jgi:DNA polymerase I-like protein with 3'-5' exonuclease and polymerase domains